MMNKILFLLQFLSTKKLRQVQMLKIRYPKKPIPKVHELFTYWVGKYYIVEAVERRNKKVSFEKSRPYCIYNAENKMTMNEKYRLKIPVLCTLRYNFEF